MSSALSRFFSSNYQNDADSEIFSNDSLCQCRKIDAYTFIEKDEDDLTPVEKENYSLDDLKKTWMAGSESQCVFISARNKTNINELRKVLYEEVKKIHIKRYPYNSFLYDTYDDQGDST